MSTYEVTTTTIDVYPPGTPVSTVPTVGVETPLPRTGNDIPPQIGLIAVLGILIGGTLKVAAKGQ